MPIGLAELQSNTRTLSVDYDGETVTIVYRPGVLTPATSDEFGKQATVEQLETMLVSWDVLDEKGKALPVSRELLDALPARFLAHLSGAILGDMRPNARRVAS